MGCLDGKVSIVTGSGRGIGCEIAIELARHGCKVVVNDVDSKPAEETVETIKRLGAEAAVCIESVDTMSGAEKITKFAVDHFGKVDILINNAGIIRDRMFINMNEQEWDDVISVHLKGHFACCKAVVNHMKQNGWGRIVNVTSKAGLVGNPGQCNYSAAKAGVMGFTKTLSMELKKYNITVNAISPGAKTRMTMSIPEHIIREKAKKDPRMLMLLNLPGPEYVAPVVAFLCTDDASEITGQIIGIRGDRLTLWSYPEEKKVAYASGKWTIEDLRQRFKEFLSG
jgi:NAD(P)-dependent dehydrogenase (short-subunit alcohol dehydrogenase family)